MLCPQDHMVEDDSKMISSHSFHSSYATSMVLLGKLFGHLLQVGPQPVYFHNCFSLTFFFWLGWIPFLTLTSRGLIGELSTTCTERDHRVVSPSLRGFVSSSRSPRLVPFGTVQGTPRMHAQPPWIPNPHGPTGIRCAAGVGARRNSPPFGALPAPRAALGFKIRSSVREGKGEEGR